VASIETPQRSADDGVLDLKADQLAMLNRLPRHWRSGQGHDHGTGGQHVFSKSSASTLDLLARVAGLLTILAAGAT